MLRAVVARAVLRAIPGRGAVGSSPVEVRLLQRGVVSVRKRCVTWARKAGAATANPASPSSTEESFTAMPSTIARNQAAAVARSQVLHSSP